MRVELEFDDDRPDLAFEQIGTGVASDPDLNREHLAYGDGWIELDSGQFVTHHNDEEFVARLYSLTLGPGSPRPAA